MTHVIFSIPHMQLQEVSARVAKLLLTLDSRSPPPDSLGILTTVTSRMPCGGGCTPTLHDVERHGVGVQHHVPHHLHAVQRECCADADSAVRLRQPGSIQALVRTTCSPIIVFGFLTQVQSADAGRQYSQQPAMD